MNIIKELREKAGISQTELAKRLHVTNDYLCMIENNRRSPSLKLAMSMAKEFDVKLDALFYANQ